MRGELRARILRNVVELKHSNLYKATDTFLQDGCITETDAERIGLEPSSEDKNHKLLEVLRTKPDYVFEKMLKWLIHAGHTDLYNRLKADDDMSCIDQEIERINTAIQSVLDDKFEKIENASTDLEDVKNLIHSELRYKEEYMEPDHIEIKLKKTFQGQISYVDVIGKERKDQRRLVIQKLRIKESAMGKGDTVKEESGAGLDDKSTQDYAQEELDTDECPGFTNMTVDELSQWLRPVLKNNDISATVIQKFKDEEIDGKAFENMNDSELQFLLPDLKWGKRKNILVDRDKYIKTPIVESKPWKTKKNKDGDEKSALFQKEDCLRAFGHARKLGDKYIYKAVIPEIGSRITDKISPVHRFVDMSKVDSKHLSSTMLKDMVEYASACMNERSNGTIHFGITDRKVEGVQIDDVIKYSGAFTESIKTSFFEEQVGIAMRCIRPPQFIPVLGKRYDKSFVVEVDIIPSSNVIGNDCFFLKSPDVHGGARLFRIDESGNAKEIQYPQIQTFMQNKTALTIEREEAEKSIGRQRCGEPNIRRELQDFLCSSGEFLENDIYPLLFVTPSDNDMDQQYLKKHFKFINCLETHAIFDFDYTQGSNTLASALTEQGEVFITKLVDEFDDECNDGKKRDIQKNLEDIKDSAIQPWIFCNGFAAKDILPLNAREWAMKKTKGFREILNFYKEQIPPGRARVLILLLSKEFDALSEAVREICLLFHEQWIVLAEDEGIATTWKETMLKNHPSCVDKATLDAKCHAGISWQTLNQTVIQFTGIPKHVTTEIPTQKGAFLELPIKLKNELCDIQMLSRNECEAEQIDASKMPNHQRDNEENFYRGLQVTWWNFYYQGQVLVRKDHRVFLNCILDALQGSINFDEKIPRAVIYHQPGAGGTTSARQVLWDLRTSYPCCLVRTITDQTADQIQQLRTFANDELPIPPVILLDNEDDESVERLIDDLLRIAKDECCRVFCLLLVCSRQIQLPFEKCPVRMTLKHELTGEEKHWFEEKNKQLHDSFKDKTGIDPKFLIAFNIMKSNFNMEAIHRTIREFIDNIPDRERIFLLFLSLVNAYDVSFQPIPVACFDPLMCKTVHRKVLGKGWEQRLEQPIRVLLNRTQKPVAIGGHVVSFRVISQLLAKEILQCLMQLASLDLTQTVCAFLESGLFQNKNAVNRMLFRSAASLMKRRLWIIKKDGDQERAVQQFLAPILQEIYDDKNESGVIRVVELAYHVLEDPMIAQQAARLHIDLGHMERAESLINAAIQQTPNNSYLHHTYGTLCRNQLLQIYRQAVEQNKALKLPREDTLLAIHFARKAIDKYKRVEEITKRGSHGSAVNPFGLIGILETVTYLLDTLSISECFSQKEDLHRFLVQSDFNQSAIGDQNTVVFLKTLQNVVDETLATLEADLNTATHENRSEHKNILSFASSGCLEKLKINLNNYFGENQDEVPVTFSDKEKEAFRRNRTKTLNCASLTEVLKKKKTNMEPVFKALNLVCSNISLKSGIGFDYLVAISCIIKLECSTGSQTSSGIPFGTCQLWNKYLYECDRLSKRYSLEANLFVILLNWPQSVEIHVHPVNHDILRSAMNDLINRSQSQSQRRKQMPLFFIGKGGEYKRIVLAHALKLYDKDKSKNPFRSRTAFERLRRFDGILEGGGNSVLVNFQASNITGGLKIALPTATRVPSRTMWNKRVNFVVGLGLSGIHVFDVTTESQDDLQKQQFELQRRHFDTSKQQQMPLVSQQLSSRQDLNIFHYHDEMQMLRQRYWYLHQQRNLCHHAQKWIEIQNEMTGLETEIRRRSESRIAAVEASRGFSY